MKLILSPPGRRLTSAITVLALMVFPLTSFASHMMGAEMSYSYMGNNKYLFKIVFYRDCRGIAFSAPKFGIYNKGCGGATLSPTRVSISDVTPRCSTASKPCNPSNTGGTGEGIEAHTYLDTVDFSSAPMKNYLNNSSCCEALFYAGQCCRGGAITTGPAGNDFYVTCTINFCNLNRCKVKTNSSPKWLPYSNHMLNCCNQGVFGDGGSEQEKEDDVIRYRLMPAINSLPNTSVSYSSPFTYEYPVTPYCVPPTTIKCSPNINTNPPRGFYFDSLSGKIIYTSTKCDEVGVISYDMAEYRLDTTGKLVQISTCRRDIEFIVKDDCGYNKSPTIKFSPNQVTVCEGDSISVYVQLYDQIFSPYQTVKDSISVNFNTDLSNATITKVLDTAAFQKDYLITWRTKKGQARLQPYIIHFGVSDQHCPKPSISSSSVTIRVKSANADSAWFNDSILKCGYTQFSAFHRVGTNPKYTWNIFDSSGTKLLCGGTGQKWVNNCSLPAGKYLIGLSIESNEYCPRTFLYPYLNKTSAIAVQLPPNIDVCKHKGVLINAKTTSAKKPVTYNWFLNGKYYSADTNGTMLIKDIQGFSKIIVQINDFNGCAASSQELQIKVFPVPTPKTAPNRNICGDSVTLYGDTANGIVNRWNNGDTGNTLIVRKSGQYSVICTNSYGCTASDSAKVDFINSSIFLFRRDTSFCQEAGLRTLYPFVAVNGKYGSTLLKFSGDLTNGGYFTTNTKPGIHTIQFTRDSGGCQVTDSMHILIHGTPKATFTTSPEFTTQKKNPVFSMINQTTSASAEPVKYTWNFGRGTSDTSSLKNPVVTYDTLEASYQIKLRAYTDSGCESFASLSVAVTLGLRNLAQEGFSVDKNLVVQGNFRSVLLRLMDASGRVVFENNDNAGINTFYAVPGVYFYRMAITTQRGNQIIHFGKTIINSD